MKTDIVEIENDGQILQRTSYFTTAQAARGEFYLTWNAGCARLLVPEQQKHTLKEMRCEHVLITKKKDRISILFDDKSEKPFVVNIALEQNDRKIDPGDCLLSVYISAGEKYQFPARCIVEHGLKGIKNASKGRDSKMDFRCARRDKAGWVKQAGRGDDKNLTEWAIRILNNAVDDDLK